MHIRSRYADTDWERSQIDVGGEGREEERKQRKKRKQARVMHGRRFGAHPPSPLSGHPRRHTGAALRFNAAAATVPWRRLATQDRASARPASPALASAHRLRASGSSPAARRPAIHLRPASAWAIAAKVRPWRSRRDAALHAKSPKRQCQPPSQSACCPQTSGGRLLRRPRLP